MKKYMSSTGYSQEINIIIDVNNSRRIKPITKDKCKFLTWTNQEGEILKTAEGLYY